MPVLDLPQFPSPGDYRCSALEIDEFVESFINMDHYDNSEIESPEEQQIGNAMVQMEMFSMANNGVYEDVPMMLEGDDHMEVSGSPIEDLLVNVSDHVVPSVEEVSHGVDQGLHLVHMLLACAEAVGCRDTQLAGSMLSQIWASVSPFSDSLQRVSYCFATGLESMLSLLHNVNTNGTFMNYDATDLEAPFITREEKMEAFQLLANQYK